MELKRTLKMGMVGGGPGAFIGEVHRKAARIDGGVEIVGGAFDIDPKRSRSMSKVLLLDPRRCYSNYKDMIEKELRPPVGQRMDFVSVTTPNNWHFPIARDLLKAGFHVLCEKPLTMTSGESAELVRVAYKTGLAAGINYNIRYYPLNLEAADRVRKGDIDKIRKIVVQYPQGWLATALVRAEGQGGWQRYGLFRNDAQKTHDESSVPLTFYRLHLCPQSEHYLYLPLAYISDANLMCGFSVTTIHIVEYYVEYRGNRMLGKNKIYSFSRASRHNAKTQRKSGGTTSPAKHRKGRDFPRKKKVTPKQNALIKPHSRRRPQSECPRVFSALKKLCYWIIGIIATAFCGEYLRRMINKFTNTYFADEG